jgi:hypothetical protein
MIIRVIPPTPITQPRTVVTFSPPLPSALYNVQGRAWNVSLGMQVTYDIGEKTKNSIELLNISAPGTFSAELFHHGVEGGLQTTIIGYFDDSRYESKAPGVMVENSGPNIKCLTVDLAPPKAATYLVNGTVYYEASREKLSPEETQINLSLEPV